MYLGNTGVLQYYVIIDWDATWFSCIRWKINPLKKVLKKSSCLGLIEFLGENKSLSNGEIEDFSTFIQTAPCSGTIYESCVITRIRMYDNHKTKTSMILNPDVDFATQFILQVYYIVTITFSIIKKKYQQLVFEIKGDHLIDCESDFI